jgi:hypothetical protein
VWPPPTSWLDHDTTRQFTLSIDVPSKPWLVAKIPVPKSQGLKRYIYNVSDANPANWGGTHEASIMFNPDNPDEFIFDGDPGLIVTDVDEEKDMLYLIFASALVLVTYGGLYYWFLRPWLDTVFGTAPDFVEGYPETVVA